MVLFVKLGARRGNGGILSAKIELKREGFDNSHRRPVGTLSPQLRSEFAVMIFWEME